MRHVVVCVNGVNAAKYGSSISDDGRCVSGWPICLFSNPDIGCLGCYKGSLELDRSSGIVLYSARISDQKTFPISQLRQYASV